MKKILRYKILILFLPIFFLMLFSCKNNESNEDNKKTIITSDILKPDNYNNYIFIGNLFDIEHVKETKKILIDENNIDFINLSSREIINEGDKSYYIVDETHPILKGYTPIYNDMSSFIKILIYLEKEANYYLKDCSKKEINNEILSFIRTTNIEYDTYIWTAVCGENNKLKDYLKNQQTGGLEIYEYFASFLSKSLFNEQLYPLTRDEYKDKYLYLIDPISEKDNIDLVHFIGALDGTCVNTENKLNEFPYNVLEERYYQMVVSWAGDLQTCAVSLEKFDLLDISFEDILKREELTCDMPDLIADMDATNIGINLDLSKIKLSDAIINYYLKIKENNNNRKSIFISSCAKQSGYDGNDINKFKLISLEILKLDENKNDYNLDNDVVEYVKYNYLRNSSNKICDISYRIHLVEEFLNYYII